MILESVCILIVEFGYMIKDLVLFVGFDQVWLINIGFLDKIDENF